MDHILVINHNENLISRLRSKALVVKTSDLFAFRDIAHTVNEFNKLHSIQAVVKGKLSDLPVTEDWGGIPVSLFIREFGDIRSFIRKSGLWRNLSVRVFLSSAIPENFTYLQMMASLGVDCGIWFEDGNTDWQAAADLLHYAIYGKTPHASIEPFVYLVDNYKAGDQTDFSAVYFNDPIRYLHLDDNGNVALSSGDLARGEFACTLDNLQEIRETTAYQDRMIAWQEVFLNSEICSSCPAWRVCLGKFAKTAADQPGCRDLFNDMMEAAEFVQSNAGERRVKELCRL